MIPESYLMHHGVDGQQWGIQNGPPYPLDRAGRRALRAQKKQAKAQTKQAKKDLAKGVAAESVSGYLLEDIEKKMRKARTSEEYRRLEKEFDELSKKRDTIHTDNSAKASELLKMNAGKNIKYANYKLYTKNNELMIKSAKNAVKNYNILTKKYSSVPQIGGAIGGAAYAAASMHDMYKNGRNAIGQYIDNL